MDTELNQWSGRQICKPAFLFNSNKGKESQKVVIFALELADSLKLPSPVQHSFHTVFNQHNVKLNLQAKIYIKLNNQSKPVN